MPPKRNHALNRAAAAGTGYAGGQNDSQAITHGIKMAEQRKEVHDKQTTAFLMDFKLQVSSNLENDNVAFLFLSEFLSPPSQQKEKVENTLKDVFRNHSPTEWDSKERCELINAALGVCDVLARDLQLVSACFGRETDDNSLLVLLRNISGQAKMIAAKSVEFGDDGGSHNMDDVNVATYFLQVQEMVERTMSQVQALDLPDSKPESSETASSNAVQVINPHGEEESVYKSELARLRRVDFIDDLGRHSFLTQPKYNGDSRRLYRELMSYQQALPVEFSTSIFVRVMDSRIDLLRALIIGPDGTPYANGCFFFDIYLPPSYPHVPPKVKFLTTGAGRVRFNPNLYTDGKVCLSLLGTWAGPGWVPNQSTLLQVLLSIQSLIFVNDPFYNEPGFERMRGTKQGETASEQYNSTIRSGTIAHGWKDHMKLLEDPAKSSYYPEFNDVILRHFALKPLAIRQQLKEWKRAEETELMVMWTRIEHIYESSKRDRGETSSTHLSLCSSSSSRAVGNVNSSRKLDVTLHDDAGINRGRRVTEIITLDDAGAPVLTSQASKPHADAIIEIIDDSDHEVGRYPQHNKRRRRRVGSVAKKSEIIELD